MALDYTYCGDSGYPRPHLASLANFKQDDGFGNLIETWPLESQEQGTRFFSDGIDVNLSSGY